MTDRCHLACSGAISSCTTGCYGEPQVTLLHGPKACIRCNSPAFADLVLFLAGDRAGNVTGADFRIDGGLITTL
ncbi:hypothetical protein [Kitasatospora sp. NPDC091207]|uniref:hypothetical protein n=1 Tax=Kitasatospora sp. NPDC091207 TaxID=3364083 RepID=UPI00381F98EE